MSYASTPVIGAALILGFCAGLTGCERAPLEAPATAPTPVSASYPIEREVTDHVDFTGRTAAVESVELRARVWGYLDKVNFREGALVKKGDVLYEIDPRTYLAALNQSKAKIALDEAQLKYNQSEYNRNQNLRNRGGAVSVDELEKSLAARDTAAASVGADKADAEQKKLDLDFTKVTAPISGRVSRTQVTVGNLVQSGQGGGGTLLTTIVSVDPIYAYFDVDEGTLLRAQRLIALGKLKSARDPSVKVPVLLGLADETGYRRQGTLDFIDNQVTATTGTLRVRGVFANKDDTLSPGMFVRIRVPMGEPHKALLVAERAIDTDQGQKILYLVNPDNKVVTRPIQVGAAHDGMRVIEDGLKPGDKVIIDNLQQLRPGAVVEPTVVEMPRSVATNR